MKPAAIALLLAACTVGEDPAPPEIDEGADTGDGEITADAITGCTQISTVIMYSEATYELRLPLAFAAAPDPCTRYYVHMPALANDKTMPRTGADKVHALGPNFHAMAEFSWSAWRLWIDASPGTRNWEIAGKEFRTRMAQQGYDLQNGDIWAINEFPTTTRSGVEDVWTHERSAVRGLATGDGTLTVKGVAYTAGTGQNTVNMSELKPNVKNWLQQDAYWTDMAKYVRWFAYEVYADPHLNCVIGSNVLADADHLSAYVEYLPQIAHEGGASTVVAASYLQHHYVPLLNESFNSNVGFGNNLIGMGDFVKFSRMQIYATHVNAAHVGYPGRRIGFAWAPKDQTVAQEQYLAGVIASSVGRAYPANKFYNYGKYACSTDGNLDGCGCTVQGQYNDAWDTFASW